MPGTPRPRYVPPCSLALIHLGLGNVRLALDDLDRAIEEHDVHLAFLTVDPKWDPLRADARFDEILRRCAFHTPKPL